MGISHKSSQCKNWSVSLVTLIELPMQLDLGSAQLFQIFDNFWHLFCTNVFMNVERNIGGLKKLKIAF